MLLFLKELLVKRSLPLWLENQSKPSLKLDKVFSWGRRVKGKETGPSALLPFTGEHR